MEPKVIFEDQDLLVLDKPSGMIVNKSDTTKGERTVQEWVEARLVIPNSFRDLGSNEMLKQVQHDTQESDFYKRAGIVHRLDKETSGLLLVAKTPKAFVNLQAQFKERKVQKTYVALAHGKIEPEKGEINVPVGRLPWNRKRFGVLSGGRESITKYKVIRYFEVGDEKLDYESLMSRNQDIKKSSSRISHLSLLEIYPQTGRTHQIRVHLKYFGHPIFSDPLYAGRKTSRNDRKLLPRIFLHASKISFLHPKSKKTLSFESLIPKKLKEFLQSFTSIDNAKY